ncbi:MAG TPA: hypothetical protein VGY54_04850 [Polyangiaceae bacterium]|jgi:hypothetical protein|nr:hypothetical protein [Polyangiaceae bacterium]
MAREKATVTLDRGKANAAKSLVRAKSLSETIDIALDRLIRAERLRHDVSSYASRPPTDEELAVGDLPVAFDLGDDDVNYDVVYARRR